MISFGIGPKVFLEQFLARPCNPDYIKMLRLWEQLSQKNSMPGRAVQLGCMLRGRMQALAPKPARTRDTIHI